MSYSLRSKGRAPLGELGDRKKTTPRKSRRRASTDDGADPASETDDSNAVSCSEAEDSPSNAGLPFVASSPLSSLIEKSWKSGIAELIGKKSATPEASEGKKQGEREKEKERKEHEKEVTMIDAADSLGDSKQHQQTEGEKDSSTEWIELESDVEAETQEGL